MANTIWSLTTAELAHVCWWFGMKVLVCLVVSAACDDSEPLLFLVASSAQLQSISLPDPRGFLPTKFGPETLINCTDSRAPQPTLQGFKLRTTRTKLEVFEIIFSSQNIRHTTVSPPAKTHFIVWLKFGQNPEFWAAFREV